jgi:hypothetical protein
MVGSISVLSIGEACLTGRRRCREHEFADLPAFLARLR